MSEYLGNLWATVNLFIFAAINFHVLLMEHHFVAINFCIFLVCLISFYGSNTIFTAIYFHENYCLTNIAKLNRFTVSASKTGLFS